jgi:hypothetical protein
VLIWASFLSARSHYGNIKKIRGFHLSASTPPETPVRCATNREASSRKMKFHNFPIKAVHMPWAAAAPTSLCSLKYIPEANIVILENQNPWHCRGFLHLQPTYLY